MNASGLNIVALLPIKGHSARIQGKNFKVFNGRPLFFWILDTLLSVPEISKIVINTDARDLLLQCGLPQIPRIQIRDREASICGDFVSMNLVIENDIHNVDADLYVMTHVTNPLLSAESIRQMIHSFLIAKEAGQADSLFTVNKVQSRFYRADGSAVNHNPDELLRTQDLEAWYEENSNAYLFTRESFLEKKARIGAKPFLFESRLLESIDIDNQEGWDLAEALAKSLFPKRNWEDARAL